MNEINQRGRVSIVAIVLVIAVSAFLPFAFMGWKDLYESFLEANPPEIHLESPPRGIGITPVHLKIQLTDLQSGLDEVVVRARQRNSAREIDRQSLKGVREAVITLEFPAEQSGFEEGKLHLEIRAFDRSLWSNRGEANFDFTVDYRKPLVEMLSTQHNSRVGGSQIAFYRAVDENLAISGVRVGNRVFQGYPARLFDTDFEDESLFVVVYAIPLEFVGNANIPVKVFAEDSVGNPRSEDFYNKIKDRQLLRRKVVMAPSFLRGTVRQLGEAYIPTLQKELAELGEELELKTRSGSPERRLEEFQILNSSQRNSDLEKLLPKMKESRFQRYWQQSFLPQAGVLRYGFGEELVYFNEDRAIATHVQDGYELKARSDDEEVVAANSGVVFFSQQLGARGFTVGIDHGLGISSVYSHLESVTASVGETVEIGDVIGVMGRTGMIESRGAGFQVFVLGVAVDPGEWLSKSWFYDHVTQKSREVKRVLGITTLNPF
ncbi:MAG: M23 family metallopeptidase [Bdellovibrionales bacterium]|nr:M23 family metallopeptidase [Bdellovibrionales bacterium]